MDTQWQKLHSDSCVVDLHNHAALKGFLFDRNLDGKSKRWLTNFFKRSFWPFSERSNFPLISQGEIDVVLSTCYIPEEEWIDDQSLIKFVLKFAPKTRKRVFDPSYFDATISMLDAVESEVEIYNEVNFTGDSTGQQKILVAKNKGELIDILADKNIAIVHSVEGAHSLQGSDSGKRIGELNDNNQILHADVLQNLEYLASRGVAYLTLAHFYQNAVASPCFPYPTYGIKKSNWENLMAGWDMNQGLSDLGGKVVKQMIDLGMIIDITHCTPKARSEVYEIVGSKKNCVMASHIGAFEVNRDPYNLQDWELRWLADHDCVVGIIFMNYWISPNDTPLGLRYIEQTIDHIRNVAGAGVIGLGTDFDGFTDPPDEITDMSQMPRLTRFLTCLRAESGRKYSDEDIKNILGGNALRLLTKGWGS